MTARHVLALVLFFAGVGVVALTCAAALFVGNVQTRLHFLTPVTSVAAPLILLGLSVDSGLSLSTASFLLILVVLMLSGPVLSAAIGRLAGQLEGSLPLDEPE
jgi:multicomponent Na+:H+ antiporter subunit G